MRRLFWTLKISSCPVISYAQNFEDVLLDRCFRDVTDGFYIDVGAWDPRHDSVTHHFYSKGWTGINIEPSWEYYEQLRAARPRDTNLMVAIGQEESGGMEFTEFRGGGISTLRALPEEYLANLHSRGFTQSTVEVPLTTLARVCEDHVPTGQTIDFLKIDVEGWEEAAIRGHDWSRWRPQVVVIESITPVSFDESTGRDVYEDLSDTWEHIVLESGYLFALHDGINRFYVRQESSHLLEHLRLPVNVLDNAVNYTVFEHDQEFAKTREAIRRLTVEAEEDMRQIAALEDALVRVSAELDAQRHRVASLLSSTSWRITAPLRSVGQLRRAGRRRTSGSA